MAARYLYLTFTSAVSWRSWTALGIYCKGFGGEFILLFAGSYVVLYHHLFG